MLRTLSLFALICVALTGCGSGGGGDSSDSGNAKNDRAEISYPRDVPFTRDWIGGEYAKAGEIVKLTETSKGNFHAVVWGPGNAYFTAKAPAAGTYSAITVSEAQELQGDSYAAGQRPEYDTLYFGVDGKSQRKYLLHFPEYTPKPPTGNG